MATEELIDELTNMKCEKDVKMSITDKSNQKSLVHPHDSKHIINEGIDDIISYLRNDIKCEKKYGYMDSFENESDKRPYTILCPNIIFKSTDDNYWLGASKKFLRNKVRSIHYDDGDSYTQLIEDKSKIDTILPMYNFRRRYKDHIFEVKEF